MDARIAGTAKRPVMEPFVLSYATLKQQDNKSLFSSFIHRIDIVTIKLFQACGCGYLW